ncbi:disease resistance protein RPP2B-like [Argentina anserina]|uniref:disease resistance protein RPP2B-like n=1 Tax=Argentina anserina TaxID=57926 RepID=UPI002176779B|nr:disease resistance protein RPP2B-like [Potentilla anserina]
MHDLLRCLGWHIVRGESPNLPGKRSRLWLDDDKGRSSWFFEDARNVLMDNTGTTAVEGLFLSLPEKEEIPLNSDPLFGFWRRNSDPFLSMSKLRLLKICNVNFLNVRLSNPCENLRLSEWHECPLKSLSSWLVLGQLVELRIPNSHIRTLWDGSQVKLNMLVRMDLSNCRYLTMTPDLSVAPNLETLILEGCTELSKVHRSIMELRRLDLLNLKGCVSLKELPDVINLPSLQTFILSGCTNLGKFPRIVDHMDTLSELYLDGTAIQDLDLSFGYLRGLVLLNLSGCKNLRGLPFSVGLMRSLKYLYLSLCSRLETLPEQIYYMSRLEELDACETAIKEFPEDIFLGSQNLKLLCFHGCSELRLRRHAPWGRAPFLTTLNLGGCNLAEGDIPDEIDILYLLQILDLSENNFLSIPRSVCQLPELREISVRGCAKLQSLPSIDPPSIKYVDIRGCTALGNNYSDRWRILPDGLRIRNCPRWDDRHPPSGVEFHQFHRSLP